MSVNRIQSLITKSPLLSPILSPSNIMITQIDINSTLPILILTSKETDENSNLLLTVDWESFGNFIFSRDNKIEMFNV